MRGERRREEEGVMEAKIREIERRMEIKKREERRRNIIVKEIRVEEGRKKEAVERVVDGDRHEGEGGGS